MALDAAGVLYVADTGNHAIRRITADGFVSTLAGDGTPGDADGSAARFNGPVGVAVDGSGRVIVADTYNDRIRAIARDGTVTTIAGGPVPGPDDGVAGDARFDTPCGVAVDAAGNIYVADTGNGALRRIDPAVRDDLALDADGARMRPIALTAATTVRSTSAMSAAASSRSTGPAGRARLPVASRVPRRQRQRRAFPAAGGNRRRRKRPPHRRRRRQRAAAHGHRRRPVERTAALVAARRPAFRRGGVRPHAAALADLADGRPARDRRHDRRSARRSGRRRFHAGVDVRIDEGTPVRAVRDGTVMSPVSTGDFGTLNEWLRLGR